MSKKKPMAHKSLPETVPPVRKITPEPETAKELFPRLEFLAEPEPGPEHDYVINLPWGYDDNKIMIMARDPETIFAYWDISEQLRNSLRFTHGSQWDESLPVLRVYDVTGIDYFNGVNANSFFDIVINDFAGNWYLHVGTPNRTFCVDLGKILKDGTFVTIARSNITSTPRNCLSDRTDPEWMLVSGNRRKLYSRIGKKGGMSSYEIFKNFVQ
ncbi:DUF4912 domain-containing protein [Phosphitispora sp. TUW77]|uniref:DUF4912 domain-containing protein n=1 Tax=Phosphitispora sp. TUW77 TaxID=3152361 RepID=UPI003AB6458D